MGTTFFTKENFRPPTDYYCDELDPIDEKLCALIAKRKEVSGNNPGFPGADRISAWCQRYGLDEYMILTIFGRLYNEERFQSRPVPTSFRRFIPVAKHVEMDGVVYAVTHIKQYANMSMVYIEISLPEAHDETVGIMHTQVELSIGSEYTCLYNSGGGNDESVQYSFSVSPPLPDHIAGVEFSLKVSPRPDMPKPRVPIKAAAVNIK